MSYKLVLRKTRLKPIAASEATRCKPSAEHGSRGHWPSQTSHAEATLPDCAAQPPLSMQSKSTAHHDMTQIHGFWTIFSWSDASYDSSRRIENYQSNQDYQARVLGISWSKVNSQAWKAKGIQVLALSPVLNVQPHSAQNLPHLLILRRNETSYIPHLRCRHLYAC